MFIATCRNRAK